MYQEAKVWRRSVPNLYEMLLPAAQRTTKFYLGRDFDPVKVGVDTSGKSGTYMVDTTLIGSSNKGHSFENAPLGNGVIGPLLTDEQRWELTGEGIGQLRTIETIDGKQIIERLEVMDNAQRLYSYTNVSGLGVTDYTGTFDLKPTGSGSSVEWRVQFLAHNQPTIIVKTILASLMKVGFEGLGKRFGTLK